MSAVRSFPPIVGDGARVLVLGSMPGTASLAAQRYYAHPRNAFWPIMGELFDAGPELAYEQRVLRLAAAGVAVWDVLDACVRPGSLDSDIASEGRQLNDFARFFRAHPGIVRVGFNGATAARLFEKGVAPGLERPLETRRLPSTSPAHAGLSLARKVEQWRWLASP